jgi:glycosyltransferase involved in cell wall biosynthesis
LHSQLVTAVVLARNEARTIGRMLDSLPAGTAALVLDDCSTDGTAAIARSRGATVIVRPLEDFVAARNAAAALVKTPWTLMIDADETLDDALREAVERASGEVDGYVVRRSTFYRGKPLRMWNNEPLLRLFRTGRAELRAAPVAGGTAQLHERWLCRGPVAGLGGKLLHDSYPTRNAYVEKFMRYTALEAAGIPASRARAASSIASMLPRFLWYLVRRRAILDGFDGITIAAYSAAYPAVVQMKALRR